MIELIWLIWENLFGVYFMLGVFNIFFGLSLVICIILNLIFFNEVMKVGMDGVIVLVVKILLLLKIDEEY